MNARERRAPPGCPARQRVAGFLQGQCTPEPGSAADMLAEAMLAAVFEVPPEYPARRRPSMYPDGTRITLSRKFSRDERPISRPVTARLLVEPGGVGLDLASQIDFSLRSADSMLGILSSRACADAVSHLARSAFPEDPEDLNDWWGGIWLGAEIGQREADLRIYFDLRSGPSRVRWQRVADMLAPFAAPSYGQDFLAMVDALRACAADPAGLGAQIRGARVRGMRLYCAMDDPDPARVARAVPRGLANGVVDIGDVLERFERRFGAMEWNAITIALDLPCGGDGLLLPPTRFKADLGCAAVAEPAAEALDDWAWALLGPVEAVAFRAYRSALDAAFGGAVLQYLSFGYRAEGQRELGAYFIPDGLSALHRNGH